MSRMPLSLLRRNRDPFAMLRHMTSELDRFFEEPALFGGTFPFKSAEENAWMPRVDVFEADNKLVTKVDLPGLKKEDVKVEIADGHLVISGERTHTQEEKKENIYRSEREYGSFYRAVPLPEGVKVDDIKATFADGVLEVAVPLPAAVGAAPTRVAIEEPAKATKAA